jgi:hypothetical protein
MSVDSYLNSSSFPPLGKELEKYRAPLSQDAVAFAGVPRKHPYDEEKILIFYDPLSRDSKILEFKVQDIVSAEDLPSPVTERGESLNLLRIWIRKGAFGMQYEPFEVADPPAFLRDSNALHDKLIRSFKGE